MRKIVLFIAGVFAIGCGSSVGVPYRSQATGLGLSHGNACLPVDQLPDRVALVLRLQRQGTGIYTMRSDGTDIRLVFSGGKMIPHGPAWSPDKQRLAFTFPGGSGIYTVDNNGCNLRRLIHCGDNSCGGATWSADGTRIAYRGSHGRGIHTLNVNNPEIIKWLPNQPARCAQNPTDLDWSPDGTEIAMACWSEGDRQDIFLYNIARKQFQNITNSPDIFEGSPAWSPDGKRIAFVVPSLLNDGSTQRRVYTMDRTGRNRRQLTTRGTNLDPTPTWSPDGSRIMFAGEDGIYIMNADGTGITRVADGKQPAWSP